MRNLMLLFFVITFSCGSKMKTTTTIDIINTRVNNSYQISKIDSVNSFYFVYCTKDEKTYKIFSKKYNSKCNLGKIKEGEYYNFELINFPDYSKNDNAITGLVSLVTCFMLDKDTQICKEKGINGLYTTENLIGLYYQPNE
ncbi:MAG: hypothetical protein LBE34_10285 [Flavobacteriaceae bacterium]|nr:hypothetical protein [Flavobacteriaceae bacterium]